MKRIITIALFVAFAFLLLTTKVFALGEGEFKVLASGGIDSSANSYAWGLTSFMEISMFQQIGTTCGASCKVLLEW